MEITINLTKAELDLVEEALLQYQKLLLESENADETISYEMKLCRRIFEEFGMEELEAVVGMQPSVPMAPEAAPSQVQTYVVPQSPYVQPAPRQASASQASSSYTQSPNQYPFSR